MGALFRPKIKTNLVLFYLEATFSSDNDAFVYLLISRLIRPTFFSFYFLLIFLKCPQIYITVTNFKNI